MAETQDTIADVWAFRKQEVLEAKENWYIQWIQLPEEHKYDEETIIIPQFVTKGRKKQWKVGYDKKAGRKQTSFYLYTKTGKFSIDSDRLFDMLMEYEHQELSFLVQRTKPENPKKTRYHLEVANGQIKLSDVVPSE